MVDTPAVEEPFSPASGRTDPSDRKTWFGHPRQLARLFTTEMWERFGYYGMRALLTLYLTKHFVLGDRASTGFYGGYTALVYLTPLIGGFIADQYLGSKRSVKFGAILLIALSTISVGNGFFKPNISTMVGALYEQGDRRRDAGFTIFYMGINLGSILGQFFCPILADTLGWWAGFSLAGVGMLVSYLLIQFDGRRLAGYAETPQREGGDKALIIYGLAILAIPVFVFLFTNLMNAPEPAPGSGIVGYIMSLSLMGKLLFGTFLLGVPGILIWSYAKGTRAEFQMMVAAMVLITFNVVFWTLFEQAGSSLTLFADRNTDRSVFGLFQISAPQTQNFNPIAIVLLAPLMSILWGALAKRNLEPSIPVKFALALVGVGVGFLFLVWGAT